jgi:DNA-binding XRE family transcriptional regulator
MKTTSKTKKLKNPHISEDSLDDYIAEQKARSPEFAAEFDRLEVAAQMRALREKAGLTQTQMALRMKTKQTSIARAESGKVIPKLDFLERYARAAGAQMKVEFVLAKKAQVRRAREQLEESK